MQLSQHLKNSNEYGRYYTESSVAQLLIESMELSSPTTAVDLGAGSGALVGEAFRHWSKTEFITVDIDRNAASSKLSALHGPSFRHHTTDVLSESLDKELGVTFGTVDCGLCNPPYIHSKWNKHFGEILEDAGLSQLIPKLGGVPADVLFIAQNLRLISKCGKLGLILSDGLIAGEKYAKFRQLLATQHTIERVIELPRRIFRKTDAKAHILVLSKYITNESYIKIQQLNKEGALSEPITIDRENAAHRLDYSYLAVNTAHQSSQAPCRTLRDQGVSVKRGAHSSSSIKKLQFPVFHTTDFNVGSLDVPTKYFLSKDTQKMASGFIAVAGDILIARVGRNLEEKICYIKNGAVSISDSVFAIRASPEKRKVILEYLTSLEGRSALRASSHGVGARFLTIESLLRIAI